MSLHAVMRMTIEEALAAFTLQLEADGRSVHTIRQYERHVRALANWFAPRDGIEEVNHVVLAQFLASDAAKKRPDGAPKKATAMNTLRSSLRGFFGYLAAAALVDRDPSRLLRRARCGAPPPRALSEDDQCRLLRILARARGPEGRRDHALFLTMLRTGIRVGSAVALDVDDFGNGELRLRRTKGDRPGRLFLPKEVSRAIEAVLGGRSDGPIFAAREGERITTRQVARRLRRWLDEAGIQAPASPHTLRHSFATGLYRRTGDVLLVKEALGHRSLASTTVYARVSPERVRQQVGP
jgi:integrase/recombinase XerD